jgi:hypothetical protein
VQKINKKSVNIPDIVPEYKAVLKVLVCPEIVVAIFFVKEFITFDLVAFYLNKHRNQFVE